MPERLTADERRRWTDVARRTLDAGPGTSEAIAAAIANRPIPLPALHAAEAFLDELDTIPGEPDPIEVT